MADAPVDDVDTQENQETTTAPQSTEAVDGPESVHAPGAAAADEAAAAENAPAAAPAAEEAPAAAEAPAADEAPAAEEVPAAEAPTEEAAPAEEAVPSGEPGAVEEAAGAPEKTPARKKPARKRAAPRKKAAAAPEPEEAAVEATPAAPAAEEPAAEEQAAEPAADEPPAEEQAAEPAAEKPSRPAAPGTMLLFQPPEPIAAPSRPVDEDEDIEDEEADEAAAEETRPDEQDRAEDQGDEEGGAAGQRRRRRRGGRRRRKSGDAGGNGNGEPGADEGDQDAEEQEADEAAAEQGDEAPGEGAGEGGPSTSRRRRRRRREGEGGDNGAEDGNTVTKVRKTRTAEDEITAVSGSTRLEAKKQRRREGREAGRRRAPIISEAEFLARRESVDRVMVVRQRQDLTQIAVLEDKVLVEHYVARESQTSLIGNVYLGRVQNVLPSMEAAFVDIGKGRNAVLYAGEVNWSALGHKEGTPRKIESVLQSGQTVLVQVTKDPVGHKGARLTSQISLAGRFLVYVPDGTTSGISRKLPDTERARLKTLLKEIVPESAGVIVRTAAEGASEEELTRDVERLKARWEDIEAKAAKGNAPQLLYGDPDLTLKVVRDLFTEDFSKLVVQGEDAWETVHAYVEHVAPDLADRLEHYVPGQNGGDVFATYRIDEQIAKGLDRKVWLPSGGSLIIDRTEAMTVIDVNTGKFTGSGGNLEETVTKNNLEAAEEIVRQLRLRDIGGIIVVDFIDMVLESNRDLVLRRLVECLGRDRTRHQVAEVTSLGLVQMTRKRIGTGLLEAFSETCQHCQGRGLIVHDLPVEPKRANDEESRRGGRRRRSKGGAGDEAPKAVPSPKDIAAMAKPPAPSDEEEAEQGADGDQAPAAAAATEQPTEGPAAVVDTTAVDAETAQPVEVVEPVELADTVEAVAAVESDAPAPAPAPTPEPVVTEPVATEPVVTGPGVPEPAATGTEPAADVVPEQEKAEHSEAPVTKVVTRTRRRAASRPAGPPASTSTAGEIGAPPEDGAVEPNVGDVEPGPNGQAAAGGGESEPAHEEPHVEHVPIKKKGARKR